MPEIIPLHVRSGKQKNPANSGFWEISTEISTEKETPPLPGVLLSAPSNETGGRLAQPGPLYRGLEPLLFTVQQHFPGGTRFPRSPLERVRGATEPRKARSGPGGCESLCSKNLLLVRELGSYRNFSYLDALDFDLHRTRVLRSRTKKKAPSPKAGRSDLSLVTRSVVRP